MIMPLIGSLGSVDFSNYFVPLNTAVESPILAEAKKQGAVLAWGNFVTVIINFTIIAFVLFLVVKGINRLRRQPPPVDAPPPAPPEDVRLLTEIRDLLAKR
jgi:large conductance mechanosensitive channel